MKPIKILYMVSNPERLSGSNRSLLELLNKLPRHILPVVVSAGAGRFVDACRAHAIETRLLPPPGRLGPKSVLSKVNWLQLGFAAVSYAPYAMRLWRTLRSERADIVHANDHKAALLVGPAAKLLRTPLVTHARGDSPFRKIAGRSVRRLMSLCYERLSDRVIAVSENTARSMEGILPKAKLRVVPNGISQPRAELRGTASPWIEALRAEGVVVISTFASIVPSKGIHWLLETAAELVKRGLEEQFIILVIGDFVSGYEQYEQHLAMRRHQLGLRNVTFTAWQSDAAAFYRLSDIVVLNSVREQKLLVNGEIVSVVGTEGFPRTILEAMMHSLPVVATDVAGVREQIVDGETGFVVPDQNPKVAAGKLELLIGSAVRRQTLGQAGRARVEALFSAERYSENIVRVYGELLPRTANNG